MPKINRELLFKEIHILKSLSRHENIIKMYEIFEEDDNIIIILELMEGGDLYSKIKATNGLPESQALIFFRQIVKAVINLHSLGILHRDIKPENVLLSDDSAKPVLKMADFGLADLFVGNKLTLQCGTPGFMAPEILNLNQPYDESIDIFSLGVTLFTM